MATVTAIEQKFAKQALWMGQPLKRKEDRRLLTGRGRFVDDVKFSGTAHVALLRSPYAHARIKRIDVSKAERIPGVLTTLAGDEVARLTKPFMQISPPPANKLEDYCLAVDKVHFVGEPVVAVAAETRAIAEDALESMEVEYETMPHVIDAKKAAQRDSPLVHEIVGTNVSFYGKWDYGNIEQAKRDADKIIRANLHFHRFSSTPIENNAVLAKYERETGFLEIYCNNQQLIAVPIICSALGLSPSKLRFVTGDIGGGFGTKVSTFPYIVLVSLLSMKLGKPVKWVEERREHLSASSHGNERSFEVEVAATRDGQILGIDVTAYDDCGAYTRYEPAGAAIWAQVTPGCYKFQNFRMNFYQVLTNKCPVGPNRGYSRAQHLWMLERSVDLVAKELGLDPIEVRLKNLIKPEDMPYVTPSGGIYDGGDYPESLIRVLRMINYEKVRQKQKEARDSNKLIGIGISTVLDSGTNNFAQIRVVNPNNPISGNSEGARVMIDLFGGVQVALGTVPQGQGHETFAAQIVADELGITPDQVVVLTGFDSLVNPYTVHSGSYASRSAVMGTGALLGATKKIREKAARIAAHLMNSAPEKIEFHNGYAQEMGTGRRISLAQIANAAWENNLLLPEDFEPGLVATHFYKPPFSMPDSKNRLNQTLTYSYQSHAAVIELDQETGKFQILDYAIVDDCGTQINPMIVEGQIHGAAAHGIGAAMLENFEYAEDGQLQSSTFIDYLVPSALDIPEMNTSSITTPSLFAPKGIRGVGEGGCTPIGAISSAVENALSQFGVTITDSHQNPERVFNLIKNARERDSQS